jgi:aminopeptidase N
VLSHLRGLYGLFYNENPAVSEKIRELLKDYSGEILKQVGWKRTPDETSTTTLIRSGAILGSGIAEDKMTLNKANKLFSEHSGEHAMDPNIRSAIYGLVAWSGSGKTYKILQKRYVKEELPEEKIKLLGSLGMFNDKKILNDALNFSLSKHVRYQDSYFIPVYVSSNPLGKTLIWGWTKKNWKTLMQRFSGGTHMLGRYVDNLAAANDPKTMQEVKAFFSNKGNVRPDIKSSINETLEIMEINSGFVKRNKDGGTEE